MLLSKLDNKLQRFGDYWDLEIETISLELGAEFDNKTLASVSVLMGLRRNAQLVLEDPDFFLRFIEVANGNSPDAGYHDIPTSLELLFALSELEIIGGDVHTDLIRETIVYILNDEGHGEAYHPLFAKYSDMPFINNEKTRAGKLYIKAMRATGGTQ